MDMKMRVTFLILFLLLIFASAEAADTVTLRLMAVNPADSEQTVPEQPGDMLMLNHSSIPLLVLQVPVS